MTYRGTFLNDKFHGFGYQIVQQELTAGERKEGHNHGKVSIYMLNGFVKNIECKDGAEINSNGVTTTDEAWFKDRKPAKKSTLS